ncbi:MAG: hypothetical protein QOD60_2038 [Solirubrobacterales bacterium]|jgi:hypothetical protein|nr:hypothetical protein [Solirubrobacterales bacterium]
MATIAVFIALGGAGYAAVKLKKNSVGTKQLKANAVNGTKVADGSLTGADINSATLGTVPNAANAANAANATAAGSAANAAHATNSDQLGGSVASKYLKGAVDSDSHTTQGLFSAGTCASGFATAVTATVDVPPGSGLVEVATHAAFGTVPGGTTVVGCISVDGASPGNQVFQTAASLTLYAEKGSTSGTTNSLLTDWLPYYVTPNASHTFSLHLAFAGTGGTNVSSDIVARATG